MAQGPAPGRPVNLREMKRSGGFLLPDNRGAWWHWYEGEQPKCPYPNCHRAFAGPLYEGRTVSTRIPSREPNPNILMRMRCRNCKKEFEIAA